MNNIQTNNINSDFDIPPFDFENSKPNKYAKLYSEDNKTIVYKSDSIMTVVLDSDIAEYFHDSKSVNTALRMLIKNKSSKKQKQVT